MSDIRFSHMGVSTRGVIECESEEILMEGYLFPLTCFGYCFVQFSISFVLVLLVMFLFWSLQGLLSAYMKQENGYGVTVERRTC